MVGVPQGFELHDDEAAREGGRWRRGSRPALLSEKPVRTLRCPSLPAQSLKARLRPGWEVLTWTSMNIDGYRDAVNEGLRRLEEVVVKANDIVDNRVEKNLKGIGRAVLVDMPEVTPPTIPTPFEATVCRSHPQIRLNRARGSACNECARWKCPGEGKASTARAKRKS